MPVGMQIQSVNLTFAGGLISSASIAYTLTGTVISGNGSYLWQLTPAEQSAAAATNFVTALVNKLSGLIGIPVTTT
jgi:hypothetical protein